MCPVQVLNYAKNYEFGYEWLLIKIEDFRNLNFFQRFGGSQKMQQREWVRFVLTLPMLVRPLILISGTILFLILYQGRGYFFTKGK